MREISLKECPWPISVKQRFITKRSISCLGVIPVPPFCIFAGRFHHFRLFYFFCLCLIFRCLCNNFKNREFTFSLFLLIKMPLFALDSPFALCSVHGNFVIYNSLRDNVFIKIYHLWSFDSPIYGRHILLNQNPYMTVLLFIIKHL